MSRPRAREFGVKIGLLKTGTYNAITDVPGVMVGHTTLRAGEGALRPGEGPVRTGVTAILPHPGNLFTHKVKAAVHVINGFGKSTGLAQIDELGTLESPILLTNTLSVGVVQDTLVRYMLAQNPEIGVTTGTINCVVGECNDAHLNDIRGGHVKPEHVYHALETASGGPVLEGAVGAGTGMSCFELKGGIGTASRVIEAGQELYNLGVLVLANFGIIDTLTIAGVPVGVELAARVRGAVPPDPGSVIIIVATDAPLESRQLRRVAKRAAFGLARTGSYASNGSGDFVFAFSTANKEEHFAPAHARRHETFMRDDDEATGWLFMACAEATEEAITNALFKAETTTGRDYNRREALPLDLVAAILKRHGRLH